jgi:hypothetical protein
MNKRVGTLFLVALLFLTGGCGSAQHKAKVEGGFTLNRDMKIRVADVSNDTGNVSDVDMIGLLWDGLSEALRKQNLLWSKDVGSPQLQIEAHIIKYQKGSAWQRYLTPGFGSTVLAVRCDLKNGQQVVATVEAKRIVAFGDGLTIGAWKKVFAGVAEDVVKEFVNKLHG